MTRNLDSRHVNIPGDKCTKTTYVVSVICGIIPDVNATGFLKRKILYWIALFIMTYATAVWYKILNINEPKKKPKKRRCVKNHYINKNIKCDLDLTRRVGFYRIQYTIRIIFYQHGASPSLNMIFFKIKMMTKHLP